MIKNWSIVRLGDIAEKITKGGTPTTYGFSFQKNGINFLKVENIQNGSINLKSITDFISEEAHQFQLKSQLNCGDILFSIAGTIGVTTIVESKHIPANTNQALAIIKGTGDTLISKFLLWQLEYFVQKVKSKARGGAMNNVSLEDLMNLNVYVPPIQEQQRIVAKIEELFSELDKGIETLKKAQQQLKVYRQAVLKYAFEGKLTNPDVKEGDLPEGWVVKSLAQITIEKTGLRRGPFGSAIKKEFFVPSGYKVYEQSNAIYNDHKLGRYYINQAKFEELKNFEVKEGDFIVSCSGTLGKIAQIPKGAESGVINQALLRIRLKENVLTARFFLFYFRAELFQRMIFDQSQGTAMNNLIGIKDFKEITITFPEDVKEQLKLVSEIESRLSVCDKIEESIEQGLQQAEALRQSILKKAFEGMLVPQDPNDESASVLLERIKAERVAAQPEKKTKAKKVKA